jgi:hypothetical protein
MMRQKLPLGQLCVPKRSLKIQNVSKTPEAPQRNKKKKECVIDHSLYRSTQLSSTPLHQATLLTMSLEDAERAIPATVRMFSGCEDKQTSADGEF